MIKTLSSCCYNVGVRTSHPQIPGCKEPKHWSEDNLLASDLHAVFNCNYVWPSLAKHQLGEELSDAECPNLLNVKARVHLGGRHVPSSNREKFLVR